MDYQTITLEQAEDIAVLTLNRPESLNALSSEMMDGLLEALPRLAADPAVRVVVSHMTSPTYSGPSRW